MKRRDFLRGCAAGVLGLAVPLPQIGGATVTADAFGLRILAEPSTMSFEDAVRAVHSKHSRCRLERAAKMAEIAVSTARDVAEMIAEGRHPIEVLTRSNMGRINAAVVAAQPCSHAPPAYSDSVTVTRKVLTR